MRLQTPPKVEKLRKALHAKAKAEPGFRFYVLYDKVYRADIVAHAYALCRANGGAAGVDGETFEAIESRGREAWLGELAQELRDKRYRAAPVRRVWLDKANGGQRPLGIPTIRDRVVQMAAVLVLEPIFEADLQPEQHAYRAGHSAHDAIRAVHGLDEARSRRGGRGRFERVLRFDSTCAVDALGGPAGQRPACAGAGQAMAGDTGGGIGRTGRLEAYHAGKGHQAWHSRKGRRSRRCCRICTCAASCWDGRCWGTRAGWAHTSSTMRTTSSSAADAGTRRRRWRSCAR